MCNSFPPKLCRSDIRLYDDLCFKYIMSEIQNISYVIGVILGIIVTSIEYVDTHINARKKDGKSIIFDCLVRVNDKYMVGFEMQNQKTADLDVRIGLTYTHLISDSSPAGKMHAEPYVNVIWFMNFAYDKEEHDPYFTLCDQASKKLFQQSGIHIIQLEGLKDLLEKDIDELSECEALSLYMKYGHLEEHREWKEKLIQKKKGIANMENTMNSMLQSPMRYLEFRREMKKRDEEEKIRQLEEENRQKEERLLRQGEQLLQQGEQLLLQGKILDFVKQGFSYDDALMQLEK